MQKNLSLYFMFFLNYFTFIKYEEDYFYITYNLGRYNT